MKNFLNKKCINLSFLFISFIFFISINFIYFYINIINYNNGIYAFNELFINYQAGFIRRGLLGEIAWQLNEYNLISPKIFFSIFFLFIHLSQFLIFFYLFKKYIFSKTLFLIIFFSPSLLIKKSYFMVTVIKKLLMS